MKTKLFILIAIISFVVSGCNKIPKKSIFTPLPTEELAQVIKIDSEFADAYKIIRETADDCNEVIKAKYYDITYKDFYAYYKLNTDTALIRTKFSEWSSEWDEEYGKYASKADSILDYWSNYKEEHSPSRFVKIEFVDFSKTYYKSANVIKDMTAKFSITPLNGPISNLLFTYRYAKKGSTAYSEKHYCSAYDRISNRIVKGWKMETLDEVKLENVTAKEFIDKYDIEITIESISANGERYSSYYYLLQIPYEVRMIWEKGTDDIMYDYYIANLIRENVYSSYISDASYCEAKWYVYLNEQYPRISEFISEAYDNLED